MPPVLRVWPSRFHYTATTAKRLMFPSITRPCSPDGPSTWPNRRPYCGVSCWTRNLSVPRYQRRAEAAMYLPAGAKIFYKDSRGHGVPVVFLHAYTGDADVWEHQIPPFTRAGYRFIAYDRRGYGRTVADANGPSSTGADDLLALVDHLRIG